MMLPTPVVDVLANLRQIFRSRNTHRRVLSATNLKEFKPGDYCPRGTILFVLATGRSILELKPEDWKHIRNGDSIALNLFLHSPFLPDVYLFEHIPDQEVRGQWLDKLPAYSGVLPSLALLPSYCLERIRSNSGMQEMLPAMRKVFGERLKLVPVLFARHRSLAMLGFSRWLNRRFWQDGLYHLRGSLSSAVDFGLKHGFSEIVLCGVDLNEKGYFYGPRKEKTTPEQDPDVAPVHYTDQAVSGLIPISAWLREIASREGHVRFWCSSASSTLARWK